MGTTPESLENGENLVVSLKSEARGTGTRQSGLALRNTIINLARESSQKIVIDFDEISMVSSSFADELIGKLVVEFGFVGFSQRIHLKNMNPIITPIINRSVSQRMMDSFSS